MMISRFIPMLCGCLITIAFCIYKAWLMKYKGTSLDARLWLIPALLMLLPTQFVSSAVQPVVDAMPPINRMLQPAIEHARGWQFPHLLKRTAIGLWALGAVALLILIVVLQIRLHKTVKRSEKITHLFPGLLNSCRNGLRINKTVEVCRSAEIHTPILAGIWKPKIILPDDTDWSSKKDMEYIFRHELTHYVRRDNLLKTFMLVINAVFWWNPFLYIIRCNIRDDCEYDCDAAVTKGMPEDERFYYSDMLLRNMEANKGLSSIVSAFAKENKIVRRLSFIMNKRTKHIFFTVCTLLFLSILTISTVYAFAEKEESCDDGSLISRVVNQEMYDKAFSGGTFAYTVEDVRFNEKTGKYELMFEGVVVKEYDSDPIAWQVEGIELEFGIEDYVFITGPA